MRGPERAQSFDRGGIGAVGRRQDAPAVDEELGETGIGAGILGAGDRMRRHEMHAVGRCGAMSRTIAPLTEPTSETIAPGFRCARDLLRHRPAGADGNAENDEVGIPDRLDIALDHAVDDAEFGHPRARLLRARGGDDLAGEPMQPRGARDRAADQAEADQRDALKCGASLTSPP